MILKIIQIFGFKLYHVTIYFDINRTLWLSHTLYARGASSAINKTLLRLRKSGFYLKGISDYDVNEI